MTRTRTGIAIGIAAVLAATFVAGAQARSHRTAAEKPLLIGISLSLSGDFSDPGKAAMRGYQLWAHEVNTNGGVLGRKVKLKIVDDASSPEPGRHELPELDLAATRSTSSSGRSRRC